MALNIHERPKELIRDPSKSVERYLDWRRDKVLRTRNGDTWYDVTGVNRELILSYIDDTEQGLNLAPGTRRGPRGARYLTIRRVRLARLAMLFDKRCGKTFAELTERDVASLFNDFRAGRVTRRDGTPYQSASDFAKIFRAFWLWHVRVQKRHGREVEDITISLDGTRERKPPFVYFTIDDLRKLIRDAKHAHRVMMWVLFDSGARAWYA
jgi:hypothetical protein